MATVKSVLSLLNLPQLRKPAFYIVQRDYKRWVFPVLRALNSKKKKMGPEPPTRRSAFLEWNHQSELFAFGKRLGEEFNKDLLQCAFTHRSYIIQEELKQKEVGIENPELNLKDNRELAHIGEKLMSNYLKAHLRIALPRFPEEGICAIHDYLMSDSTLAHISKNLGTTHIILSSDFPVEESTYARTLKAIIGALSESSGEEKANLFVRDFVLTHLAGKDINDFWQPEDPMSVLSEILKRDGRGEPEPRLINEAGRNTILASYQVGIYSDKEFIGIGYGESIQIAIEMAAFDSLKRLFKTTENMKPFSFTMDVNAVLDSKSRQNVNISDWSSKKLLNVVQC